MASSVDRVSGRTLAYEHQQALAEQLNKGKRFPHDIVLGMKVDPQVQQKIGGYLAGKGEEKLPKLFVKICANRMLSTEEKLEKVVKRLNEELQLTKRIQVITYRAMQAKDVYEIPLAACAAGGQLAPEPSEQTAMRTKASQSREKMLTAFQTHNSSVEQLKLLANKVIEVQATPSLISSRGELSNLVKQAEDTYAKMLLLKRDCDQTRQVHEADVKEAKDKFQMYVY